MLNIGELLRISVLNKIFKGETHEEGPKHTRDVILLGHLMILTNISFEEEAVFVRVFQSVLN